VPRGALFASSEEMRLFLVALLALHGALHLLGFLHAWKLAALPGLSGQTTLPLSPGSVRVAGVLWLLACLIFVAAAVLAFLRHDAWWMLAAPGLVLSQALIVLQWQDAKAGSVANALILLAVVVGFATSRFERATAEHVRSLLAEAREGPRAPVSEQDIGQLPEPVQRWLRASSVLGKERVRSVRLTQRGTLRTAADQKGMPATAEQYFSVEPPAFVWAVDVVMFGVIPVVGRDRYSGGHGHMLIRGASLFTLADARGPNIDQGTLLRFLGETVWFPSAALSDVIRWQPLDATRARASMSYAGVSASAVFVFDERGRFSALEAERYFERGGVSTLEPWRVTAEQWKSFSGVEVPVRGRVTWRLQSGDFEYYVWEIVDLEYDPL